MTEDILDMMAKAKATKKKVAKKKAAKKVQAKDEVVRIPDKPVVPVVKEIVKVDRDLKLVQGALKEYRLESNIPIVHPYWQACSRIRLRSKG